MLALATTSVLPPVFQWGETQSRSVVLCHPSCPVCSTEVVNSLFRQSPPVLRCWVLLTSHQNCENCHGTSLADGSGSCTYECHSCVWVCVSSQKGHKTHVWEDCPSLSYRKREQVCSFGPWAQFIFTVLQYTLLSITRLQLGPKYFLSPLRCLICSKYWSSSFPP